jgi:hypothetical protein
MPKVLTSTSVVQQHVRTTYIDAISSQPQILTVYTGLLFVDFEQDDNRRPVDIQYPLLGRFPDGGKGAPGIITINVGEQGEFKGAVATVGLSDIVDQTDPALWQLRDVRADLREVTLRQSGGVHLSVVLSFSVEAQNSRVGTVSYQVSVVTSFPRASLTPLTLPAPILINNSGWDGLYKIGPVAVPGTPNL